MKKINLKKLIICCFIAICFLWHYPAVSLMAKDAPDNQQIAEVEAFIKELYEAQTNRDVDWIRARLEDDDAVNNWAIKLGKLYSDNIGLGFMEFNNIEMKIYPTSYEDYFIAHVTDEMVIEWNGEAISLPGYTSYLVKQCENSKWCITYGTDLPDELAEKMKDEILQLYDENYYEIMDMVAAVSTKYSDILANTPGLADWLDELDSKMSEWYTSENFMEKDIWDYLFGEEHGVLTASLNGEKDSIYIVQKGDCLWRIAERELGDGLYWVKLYEANRDVIGENPDLLWVGIELDLGNNGD